MSGLVSTATSINKKTNKIEDIKIYANTTNGPSYKKKVCVTCQNRATQANFKLSIDK